MSEKPKLKIFISYSHHDKKGVERLKIHLHPLIKKEWGDIWFDGLITPGEDWDLAINNALDGADIVLFLFSPDLIASDYVERVEASKALERYERKETIIIPVILAKCDFRDSDFSKFQAVPSGGKPIKDWKNEDGYQDAARQIIGLVKKIAT